MVNLEPQNLGTKLWLALPVNKGVLGTHFSDGHEDVHIRHLRTADGYI